MKTVLVVLLIALAVLAFVMSILRIVLYFAVVVPNLPGRGARFWLNTLLGDTLSRDTKSYIASLPPERRAQWPNWFMAYSGYLIVLVSVVWCLILAVVK